MGKGYSHEDIAVNPPKEKQSTFMIVSTSQIGMRLLPRPLQIATLQSLTQRQRSQRIGTRWMSDAFDVFKDRINQDIGDRIDKRQQNGFKLFGIEEKFDIDGQKLQREMHKLQNLLHPDRFVDGDMKTQETSAELSAMVNDFYHIISHPYKRAKYLLSLMTNTNQDELEESLGNIQLDGEFLARMMDISEKAQCPSSDRLELTKLALELDMEMAKLTKNLRENFEAKRIEKIYGDLARLKFIANCHTSLSDRLGSIDSF